MNVVEQQRCPLRQGSHCCTRRSSAVTVGFLQRKDCCTTFVEQWRDGFGCALGVWSVSLLYHQPVLAVELVFGRESISQLLDLERQPVGHDHRFVVHANVLLKCGDNTVDKNKNNITKRYKICTLGVFFMHNLHITERREHPLYY